MSSLQKIWHPTKTDSLMALADEGNVSIKLDSARKLMQLQIILTGDKREPFEDGWALCALAYATDHLLVDVEETLSEIQCTRLLENGL